MPHINGRVDFFELPEPVRAAMEEVQRALITFTDYRDVQLTFINLTKSPLAAYVIPIVDVRLPNESPNKLDSEAQPS